MIDIETLSTNTEACIVSIGAVAFDVDGSIIESLEDHFYRNITIDSNLKLGREINGDTLRWWFNQDDIAIKALTVAPIITLGNALNELTDWFSKNAHPKARVWANGTTFDLAILRDAYSNIHKTPPWHFRAESCMRAIRALGETIGHHYFEYCTKMGMNKHDALHDAIMQSEYVKHIFNTCSNSVGRDSV